MRNEQTGGKYNEEIISMTFVAAWQRRSSTIRTTIDKRKSLNGELNCNYFFFYSCCWISTDRWHTCYCSSGSFGLICISIKKSGTISGVFFSFYKMNTCAFYLRIRFRTEHKFEHSSEVYSWGEAEESRVRLAQFIMLTEFMGSARFPFILLPLGR